MAFLLAGVALGATAIALSDIERDSLSYLGVRNGVEIYQDRVTGMYYLDNGWDVKVIGKVGWHSNPVDRERLKSTLEKYSPSEIKWIDYILACYIGNEKKLWNHLFQKYEMPRKPKKPTAIISDGWSQKLRKTRWEKYEGELKHWEESRKKAIGKFREECAYWDKRKREFNSSDLKAGIQASGRNMVRTALSGGTLVVDIQPSKSDKQQFRVVVPRGLKEGDLIPVTANGKVLQVAVPAGVKPGQEIQFEVPKTTTEEPKADYNFQPPPITNLDSVAENPTKGTPITVDNPFDSDYNNTISSVPPPAVGSSIGAPPPAIGMGTSTNNNTNGTPPIPPPPAIGGQDLNAKKSSQKLVKPGSFDFS